MSEGPVLRACPFCDYAGEPAFSDVTFLVRCSSRACPLYGIAINRDIWNRRTPDARLIALRDGMRKWRNVSAPERPLIEIGNIYYARVDAWLTTIDELIQEGEVR